MILIFLKSFLTYRFGFHISFAPVAPQMSNVRPSSWYPVPYFLLCIPIRIQGLPHDPRFLSTGIRIPEESENTNPDETNPNRQHLFNLTTSNSYLRGPASKIVTGTIPFQNKVFSDIGITVTVLR